MMNFGQSISTCMGKYATFAGRATRSEFWWFYLFTVLMGWGSTLAAAAMLNLAGPAMPDVFPVILGFIPNIVSLIFLIPFLAAGSRRLHDIGKSGWWQLIIITGIGVILLIVWWVTDTKPEGEKYNEVGTS